jgi:hypothetical protein
METNTSKEVGELFITFSWRQTRVKKWMKAFEANAVVARLHMIQLR